MGILISGSSNEILIDGSNSISNDGILLSSSTTIQGDFSNPTVSERTVFKTSVTDGNTKVALVTNGTSTTSGYETYNGSDIENASYAEMRCDATAALLFSAKKGTGSYLPLKVLTGNAERLIIDEVGLVSINTAGQGLQLPNSVSADSTTLDWYEEGTFMPVVIGTTTAGVGTYTSQYGKYTRIGDLCFIECYVAITAHTGTGSIWITGLPFVKANSSYDTVVTIEASNLTYTNDLVAHIRGNNSYIQPTNQISGGSATLITMDTAFSCSISGCYKV